LNTLNNRDEEPEVSVRCLDSDDVEGLLVDLGVGYFDESGDYHDGPEPLDDEMISPDDFSGEWELR
jgi:hypothetical protein